MLDRCVFGTVLDIASVQELSPFNLTSKRVVKTLICKSNFECSAASETKGLQCTLPSKRADSLDKQL